MIRKEQRERLLDHLRKVDLHYVVLVVLIISLSLIMGGKSRYFFTLTNFDVMVNNFIMEAIMALGMTMVIISGGIDISVSGVLPFIAIVFANLLLRGIPVLLAALIAIFVSCLIGLANNWLRRVLNIHPMIVTMAMQLTLRGLNLAVTDGSVISGFSQEFQKINQFKPLGISISVWIYILLAFIFLIYSKQNKMFLNIFFVGGNKEAATLSGMNTEGVLRFVYVLNAALAGLAGVLSTTVYNSASYSFGQGVEMRVITAVAIGGTSLTHGGSGSIIGTIFGTVFLALIYNAFVMSGISTYYQDVFTGLMLILAVLLSEGARMIKEKSVKQASA